MPANVISISSSRLTDRLAAASLKSTESALVHQEAAEPARLMSNHYALPGQEEALEALRDAVASTRAQAHILVTGPSGTGKRTAIGHEIDCVRHAKERPQDWLYAWEGHGKRLKAFALPHGQGALFLREVETAIARANANHARITSGDDYRLGLELIDEEFRHRSSKTLEILKRRAESQNIALVKTPEGFVLAPMHEGKVVRNDVFRALPESLQRDVEGKIANLEGELKQFVESLPSEDAAKGERLAAFNRDAASRAVKTQFEALRSAFSVSSGAIDTIENGLVGTIANGPITQTRRIEDGLVLVTGAQIAEDFSAAAPVVTAHDVSPEALLGAFAFDPAGRLSLSSGALMRANGGFLLVEAWRLATVPGAWAALSAALETREVHPRASGSLAIEAEPIPLTARVVMIADAQSLKKLKEIDPGALRFFPHTVAFNGTAPRASLNKKSYADLALRVGERKGLRAVTDSGCTVLYEAATVANSVSLDLSELANLLISADSIAGAAASNDIRKEHVETALKRVREAQVS